MRRISRKNMNPSERTRLTREAEFIQKVLHRLQDLMKKEGESMEVSITEIERTDALYSDMRFCKEDIKLDVSADPIDDNHFLVSIKYDDRKGISFSGKVVAYLVQNIHDDIGTILDT